MLVRLLITLFAFTILAVQWWRKPNKLTKKEQGQPYPILNLIRLLFYFIFGIASLLGLLLGSSDQLALLYFPFIRQMSESSLFFAESLGWVVFGLGWLFAFWGRTHLGNMWRPGQLIDDNLNPQHRLITSGPYSLVRHPIYVGECLLLAGLFLIYWLWPFGVFAIDRFILCYMRAKYEEKNLAVEFGEAWKQYERSVPGFIPSLKLRK